MPHGIMPSLGVLLYTNPVYKVSQCYSIAMISHRSIHPTEVVNVQIQHGYNSRQKIVLQRRELSITHMPAMIDERAAAAAPRVGPLQVLRKKRNWKHKQCIYKPRVETSASFFFIARIVVDLSDST